MSEKNYKIKISKLLRNAKAENLKEYFGDNTLDKEVSADSLFGDSGLFGTIRQKIDNSVEGEYQGVLDVFKLINYVCERWLG